MKTDPKLGQEIKAYLCEKNVETPFLPDSGRDSNTKIRIIETAFGVIMDALDLDDNDDSLHDSPKRVAKMYVNEIFCGLDYNNFPKCTVVENRFHYDEMVLSKDITCISVCEHHFATIDMKVAIAYIPNGKVLGLSKLNRIAKFFAQRPQVQERYTAQVWHALNYILKVPDIAVVVEGKHYCVIQRGVEDTNSNTITSKLGGGFKSNEALRAEFMSLIHK